MSCLYQIQKNKMTTTSIVMPNDLSDLCRVCLQLPEESQYLDLNTIYDEDDNLTYSQCFTICTQIYLTAGQGVPHHLCKSCGLELQMSYDFRKKVDESNRVLQQYERQMQEDVTHQQKQLQIETQTQSQQENINPEQHHLDQSIKVLRLVEDHTLQSQGSLVQQDYVSASEEEEENAVDMLLKISPGDNVQDISINMGLINSLGECVGVEEHLELEDFQNIEALEEEDSIIMKPEQRVLYEEYLDEQLNIDEIWPNNSSMFAIEHNGEEKIEHEKISIAQCINPGVRPPITKKPQFQCEYCDHMSASKALLSSHRHRKHRNMRDTYQCEKCKHYFNTKQQFERHLKRPTCDRYPEYNCEYCSKKIKGLSNFNIHMRFHNKTYPFVCVVCGKGFMLAVHLKVHTQTKHEHKRYICEQPNCGKQFQSQHALKSHIYIHLGSMPYRCEYCEKMFPNKGRLRYHIQRSHDLKLTLQELDRMLVGEVIQIRAEVKSVELENNI